MGINDMVRMLHVNQIVFLIPAPFSKPHQKTVRSLLM